MRSRAPQNMNFLAISEISWNFHKFHEFPRNFWHFTQIWVLRAPWSARLLNPCFFLREIKVSWRVADGWKHKISWFSLEIMKLSQNPWNFINFHDFRAFRKISAPQRWQAKKDSISYAFSMVVVLIFLPGHGQIWFFTKILVPNQYFGHFHEISWNFDAEWYFRGSEGSLAGPGWKP